MSAYRFQLIDAKNDIGIRNVAGNCSNTVEFSDLVNRVTRRLLKRGAWWGTEVLVRLCIDSCNIVWPRYVGAVEGIRFCNAGQADIKNNWYSILGPRLCGDRWMSNIVAVDNGTSPCFSEISDNTGKLIRYHVVKSQDVGKTITFFGKQFGGQPLQQLDTSSNWQMGLTLAAATPIAQTSVLITKINQVTRQATQGMTYVYEYESATNQLRMLAAYEPNETNPQYRRSVIQNFNALCLRTDDNGRKSAQLEALVKLEFIPATNDLDFLLIDDFDALAFGIQAIKLQEAGDIDGGEKFWIKAISELNFESRNKDPGQTFTTQVNVMGSGRTISNFI